MKTVETNNVGGPTNWNNFRDEAYKWTETPGRRLPIWHAKSNQRHAESACEEKSYLHIEKWSSVIYTSVAAAKRA